MNRDDPWEVIASYTFGHEAQISKALLASRDIEAKIFDENASRIMPHLGPILPCRLVVRTSKANEARAILDAMTEGKLRDPDFTEEPRLALVPPKQSVSYLDYAYRTATWGFMFLPGITGVIALYFLYLNYRKPPAQPIARATYKFWLTLALSLGGIALFLILFWPFLQADPS